MLGSCNPACGDFQNFIFFPKSIPRNTHKYDIKTRQKRTPEIVHGATVSNYDNRPYLTHRELHKSYNYDATTMGRFNIGAGTRRITANKWCAATEYHGELYVSNWGGLRNISKELCKLILPLAVTPKLFLWSQKLGYPPQDSSHCRIILRKYRTSMLKYSSTCLL